MIIGNAELIREAGSKYGVFRYTCLTINGFRITVVQYFVLLRSKNALDDNGQLNGTRVKIPYKISKDEYNILDDHITRFSIAHDPRIRTSGSVFYLIKGMFEPGTPELSEWNSHKPQSPGLKSIIILPFDDSDVVKEFVFFDDWCFSEDKGQLLSALEKNEEKAYDKSLFLRMIAETFNPVTDKWFSGGKILSSDLKKLVLKADFFEIVPTLKSFDTHVRDVNIYDKNTTYVIKAEEGTKFSGVYTYIIEKYHVNKNARYLAYYVLNNNFLLRRLFYELNGKSTDEIESDLIAVFPVDHLNTEILMYLSEAELETIINGFSDIEMLIIDKKIIKTLLQHYKEKSQQSRKQFEEHKINDTGYCFLPPDRLNIFRATGNILSIDLSDKDISAIKYYQSSARLMTKKPMYIIEANPTIKNDWTVDELPIKSLQYGDRPFRWLPLQ